MKYSYSQPEYHRMKCIYNAKYHPIKYHDFPKISSPSVFFRNKKQNESAASPVLQTHQGTRRRLAVRQSARQLQATWLKMLPLKKAGYPPVITNIAVENGSFIADLPIEDGDFP